MVLLVLQILRLGDKRMATYNFTVRAEDESGAFADRDFSIQIRNNLINRILIANNDDIAISPDGVTFTRQLGRGGIYAGCWLKKWIIFTDPSTYRLSPDGISWFENNKLQVQGDSVFGNIVFETAAHIRNGTMIEHNGLLYMLVASPSGRPTLIRSSDLITWTIVKPETFSATHNNNLGIPTGTSTWTSPEYLSNATTNLFLDNGKISFMSQLFGSNKIWTYDHETNTVSLKNCNVYLVFATHQTVQRFNSIDKINGIYISQHHTMNGVTPDVRFTLGNDHAASHPISVANGNSSAYSSRYRHNFFYHNGSIHTVFGKNYYHFKTPQKVESLHSTAYGGMYCDCGIFKGKMWWIDTNTVRSSFDMTVSGGVTTHAMPSGFNTGTAHSIAILK